MKAFKRIALFLATVMIFFTMTACSSQPTTPTVTNPETNTTTTSKGEVELVNQDGIKIILIGGLDLTGSSVGPRLKLRIENSSGHDITVQSRKTSVNGYTIGDFGVAMSIDVQDGQKAYGYFTIFGSELKNAEITTIHEIKTSFHTFYSGKYGSSYFDTDLITISF